jgi:hypothetical protein
MGSTQEAKVQISRDPIYEKQKTSSLFFMTLANSCISCVISVICAMSISVVKIFES